MKSEGKKLKGKREIVHGIPITSSDVETLAGKEVGKYI